MITIMAYLLGIPIDKLEKVSHYEYNKHQLIRVIDVLVLAPFLLYVSTLVEKKLVKYLLISLALAIVIYNSSNYFKSYSENLKSVKN